MTDPVSILAIVNGSIGLAMKVGTVVKDLYNLSKRLKYAELTIQSIASECETIQAAWEGIQAWAEKQPTEYDEGRQRLFDRLNRSLLFGTMVFSKLEEDLREFTTKPQSSGFFSQSKIVWNEVAFAQHQDRIRGQVAAMTLLLQVIDLPTSTDQTALLIKDAKILSQSDESAGTIVDFSDSHSNKHPGSRSSMESGDTIYVKFDFEPELLTGRAYWRSYNYLARNLPKARGKEVARDVRAELHVRGNGQGRDKDHMSIFSVARNPEPFDCEDQKHAQPNVQRSPLPTGPKWGMIDGVLSRCRDISPPPTLKSKAARSQQRSKSQRVEMADGQVYFKDLDLGKLYWAMARYPVALKSAILGPRFVIKIQQHQTSVYRTVESADEFNSATSNPKLAENLPWRANQHKTSPLRGMFILSMKMNQQKNCRRLTLDIDVVELQRAISELVSAPRKMDPQPQSSSSFGDSISKSSKTLAIMGELQRKIGEIDGIFEEVLTYFIDRLVATFIHEVGETSVEALNECKDDVMAIYRSMMQTLDGGVSSNILE